MYWILTKMALSDESDDDVAEKDRDDDDEMTGMSVILVIGAVIITTAISLGIIASVLDSIISDTETAGVGEIAVSLLSLIINVILTLGLLYIYKRQNKLLDEQRDFAEAQVSIQKGQQDIMKAEYIPVVDIEVDGVENDSIILQCSNAGTGLAKGFAVDVEFYVSTESVEPEHFQEVDLQPLSDVSFTYQLDHQGSQIEVIISYAGVASKPRQPEGRHGVAGVSTEEILHGRDNCVLEFSLSFNEHREMEGPNRLDFDEGVDKLLDEGMETLGISMYISYEDIFDEEVTRSPLMTSWVDIREGTTVEELVEKSNERTILTIPAYRSEGKTYKASYRR
jgi:hypothetical protein